MLTRNLTGAAVLALVAACGTPDNWLEGSIAEEYSLEFNRVTLTRSGCNLRVDYLRDGALGTTVPCRLVIDTFGLGLSSGATVAGSAFLDAVEISRQALTGGGFPATTDGSITFSSFGLDGGSELTGSFAAKFDGGLGMSGKFDGTVVQPDPDDSCP